jgi:hypothetical protein
VFTRSGSAWTQRAEILDGGDMAAYDSFGRSVSLGADGSTRLIGSPGKQDAGAAFVAHSG